MKAIFYAFFLLWVGTTWGATFNTEYIEFQLPPGWKCLLEGAEWVCQSENKDRQKEAIIIMAAKEQGSQDTLSAYEAYLREQKRYTLPNKKVQVSDAKYTKRTKVNQHGWVDSLHLASEVPGFYTRYMATIKGDLGIAVTYSVAKDHYEAYRPLFEKIIRSMRVFAISRGQLANTLGIKKKEQDLLGGDLGALGDLSSIARVSQKQKKSSSGSSGDMIFYGLLALGVVGFIVYKKMKG